MTPLLPLLIAMGSPMADSGPPAPFLETCGDQVRLFDGALELSGLGWQDFRFDPDVVAVWGGPLSSSAPS